MKKISFTFFTLLIALLAAVPQLLPAAAGEPYTFSYYQSGEELSLFGTQKKENYNIAIKLPARGMQGVKVEKIVVPMPVTGGLSNLKVWLASGLTLDAKKQFTPDLYTQDAPVGKGYVEVTLNTPYTLKGDSDVYVGYSFSVDQLNDSTGTPVEVSPYDYKTGGAWILSSRTYLKWTDITMSEGSSTMRVVLSDMKENAVAAAFEKTAYTGVKGENTEARLTLTNAGTAAVKSIDYTVSLSADGREPVSVSGTSDPGYTMLAAGPGSTSRIKVALPPAPEAGSYAVRLTIDKINGTPVADGAGSTAAATLSLLPYRPVHRAVLETYVSTGGSSCPRAYAALDEMNSLYPDDFIGLAYHLNYDYSTADPMAIMTESQVGTPDPYMSFPSAWLDRDYLQGNRIDPYYGSGYDDLAIQDDWKLYCQRIAPADIAARASLSDDGRTIKTSADVTVPVAETGNGWKVEFVLLADSLSSQADAWDQQNSLSGNTYMTDPALDIYTKGDEVMKGLKYNNVVIASSRLNNTDAPLPGEMQPGEKYTVSCEFPVSAVVNLKGESLIQDLRHVRAAALLIDTATGSIVNAGKTALETAAGITTRPVSDRTSRAAAIYDLSGRRTPAMHHGLNIVRTADGRTLKVAR